MSILYPNFVKGVMYFFVRFLSFYEQIGPLFSPQSLLLLFCFQTYLWKRAPSLLLAVWASSSRPRSLGRAHGARAASSHCRTLLQSHTHLLHFAFPGNTPAATSFVFFFNSLRHMLGVRTCRHIYLTSMFLPSGLKEQVGSIQMPNSKAFQSGYFIKSFYF